MKKKYYVVLITFAILLITSMAFIGLLNNKLVKKNEQDNSYSLCGVEVQTIAEYNNVELTLTAYNYTSNSTVYTKTYEYSAENPAVLVSNYTEYLVTEENFLNSTAGEQSNYLFTKNLEESGDIFTITLSYSDNFVSIQLQYTYVN